MIKEKALEVMVSDIDDLDRKVVTNVVNDSSSYISYSGMFGSPIALVITTGAILFGNFISFNYEFERFKIVKDYRYDSGERVNTKEGLKRVRKYQEKHDM